MVWPSTEMADFILILPADISYTQPHSAAGRGGRAALVVAACGTTSRRVQLHVVSSDSEESSKHDAPLTKSEHICGR